MHCDGLKYINYLYTLSSLASLSSLSRYLPRFFQGRWQGRKILSSLSALTCAVKLRLCVVGAVIGGPPVAMLFISTPQSRLAPCQLPVKGSLLVRFTSLHIKPALKGEVANVVSRRGYKAAYSSLFITTPQSRLAPCQLPVRGAFNSLSQTFGLPAPSKKEPFGALYKLLH